MRNRIIAVLVICLFHLNCFAMAAVYQQGESGHIIDLTSVSESDSEYGRWSTYNPDNAEGTITEVTDGGKSYVYVKHTGATNTSKALGMQYELNDSIEGEIEVNAVLDIYNVNEEFGQTTAYQYIDLLDDAGNTVVQFNTGSGTINTVLIGSSECGSFTKKTSQAAVAKLRFQLNTDTNEFNFRMDTGNANYFSAIDDENKIGDSTFVCSGTLPDNTKIKGARFYVIQKGASNRQGLFGLTKDIKGASITSITDMSGREYTLENGSIKGVFDVGSKGIKLLFDKEIDISRAEASLNDVAISNEDIGLSDDCKELTVGFASLLPSADYTLKLSKITADGEMSDYEIDFVTSQSVSEERIIYSEDFIRSHNQEITDGNVTEMLGEGWSIYRTSTGNVTADGVIELSGDFSADDGGAVKISSSNETLATGVRFGLKKKLDTPAFGEVSTTVSTCIDRNAIVGVYQGAFIADGNDKELARIFYDNNQNIKITMGEATATVVSVKALSFYYDIKFIVNTFTGELDFVLYLNQYNAEATLGSGFVGESGKKIIDGEVCDSYIVRPKTPYRVNASTGVGAVTMYSENSGNSVRRASFDNLLIHNISAAKVAEIRSDRGESISDGKISVLTKQIEILINKNIDASRAVLSVVKDDGTIVPAVLNISDKKFLVDFEPLEMNGEYTIIIYDLYDRFGCGIEFSVPITVGGFPVTAGEISVLARNAVSVGYRVNIKNDYEVQKNAVVMLIQYGSDKKIKKIQITDMELSPMGVTQKDVYLDYDAPKSGDRIELLIWNSFDHKDGIHPLLSLNNGCGFDIE